MASVEGLTTLLERFEKLPAAVAAELDEELAINVEQLQRDAVDLMPSRTGNGRAVLSRPEAIRRDKSPDTGGARYTFGFITPAMRKAAFYLFWVEFGTKGRPAVAAEPKRGKRGKAKKGKRAVPARKAQPFFRPAVAFFSRRMEQQKSLAKVAEAAKAAVGWLSTSN